MSASPALSARTLLRAALLYLALLTGVVVLGAAAFRDLYDPADAFVASEQSRSYRQFLGVAGATLAVHLAVWSAAYGAWRGRAAHGLVALAVGTIGTALALLPLPWVYFPLDRYAPAALWVVGNALPALVGWALATVLGRAASREGAAAG